MITHPATLVSTVTEVRTESTSVCADLVDGRVRTQFRSGLLRVQQVRADRSGVRVALIANTALLLGGDHVELQITVGEDVRLEVFEVAGTVAYHGRGRPASWSVRAEVAARGELIMIGEPFVVCAGAEVERTLQLRVAAGGGATVRETVVLGRSGEVGGGLRNRTVIDLGDAPLLREDQHLDPQLRSLPGVLGSARVIDTLTTVGGIATSAPPASDVARFTLLDGAGTMERWIGTDLADSPLRAGAAR